MKQVQRLLMAFFIAAVVLPLVLVVLFETGFIASGLMAGDTQSEFLLTSTMELVTLAFAFLALRLFKFGVIHKDLVSRQAKALLKWGFLRLLLIQFPLLYYLYMKPTFGYLAIILALCLPFVYPSMDRCLAEVAEEEEVKSEA